MTWWTWSNDEETGGILELALPVLEMHWRLVDGRTIAWWLDARGRRLKSVHVGLA